MRKYKHSVSLVSFADSSAVLLLSHFLRPEILKRPAGNTSARKDIKGAPHPRELPRIVKPKKRGGFSGQPGGWCVQGGV